MILVAAVIAATPMRSAVTRRAPVAEQAHHLVDLLLGDDERRRQHDQIAIASVGVPHVGPDHETRLQGGRGNGLGKAGGARERLPGDRVGHELDAGQQTPAAHVADERQLAERLEPRVEHPAHPLCTARSGLCS